MSVIQRGNKLHYRFTFKGKIYSGVCPTTSRKEAEKYEKKVRAELGQVLGNKSVRALVENYRYELTGGHPIELADAYDLYLKKPSRREASSRVKAVSGARWATFLTFMRDTYPGVKTLAEVRREHADSYVSHLVGLGLASGTLRHYTGLAHSVFTRLKDEAGLISSPFENVVVPVSEKHERQIFTEEELKLIRDHLDEVPLIKPLFLVASVTGLTEGDICTLRWSELDFDHNVIHRVRRKTKVSMTIPMFHSLREYLLGLPHEDEEYIFPELARRYAARTLPRTITAFLVRLGIEKTVPGKAGRSVSVKDLHSMRHVFCYYAGQVGIPLATVQSIVGHMTPEMTKHYMSHVTDRAKLEAIEKLPTFLNLIGDGEAPEDPRRRLAELAYSLPLEQVQSILRSL